MNSTSSDSSIETQLIQHEKRMNVVQDEGYSTWSSTDVKEERIEQSLKSGDIDEKSKTIGLVKHWLDASKRSDELTNQLGKNTRPDHHQTMHYILFTLFSCQRLTITCKDPIKHYFMAHLYPTR